MKKPPTDHSSMAHFAARLALAAGAHLEDAFQQSRAATNGRTELASEAAAAVERFAVAEIRRRFPGQQVLVEKDCRPGVGPIDARCWLVDPLAGGANLSKGRPFFCVSVAFLYEGEPVLGAVYDPVRRELFHAQQGMGSFVNSRRLALHPGNSARVPVGGTLRAPQIGPDPAVLIQRFGEVHNFGAQALHLCCVAAGRLRAAINNQAHLWEDAAGALVAQEAGARYTDFHGDAVFPLGPRSQVLAGGPIQSVAAEPSIHREVIGLLATATEPRGKAPEVIAL